MSDGYRVVLSDAARKELRKMDPQASRTILSWLNKNLQGCENPRWRGKALTGGRADQWSYRIGSYRVLANIRDEEVVIYVLKVGHRGKVYRPTY
jgi:mRNA interferase RelE/StbE